MSNELFFDINEEQQEAVAGGSFIFPDVETIYDDIYTYFKEDKKSAMLEFDVASGPKGSFVTQKFAFDKNFVDTYADKKFRFY